MGCDLYRVRTLKYYLGPRDDDTHSVELCLSPATVSLRTKKKHNKKQQQYNTRTHTHAGMYNS